MSSTPTVSESEVWELLQDVPDPEIPAISVVDLGIIRAVRAHGDQVHVEVMPTFIACPAIGLICQDIENRLRDIAANVCVTVTYEEQWSSDRITERGRGNLRNAGYAPPIACTATRGDGVFPLTMFPVVECPFCSGTRTRLENAFGPTLCRSIYYCPDCRQPFEHFKSV